MIADNSFSLVMRVAKSSAFLLSKAGFSVCTLFKLPDLNPININIYFFECRMSVCIIYFVIYFIREADNQSSFIADISRNFIYKISNTDRFLQRVQMAKILFETARSLTQYTSISISYTVRYLFVYPMGH